MIFKKAFPFLGIGLLLLILFLPGYTKIQELRDRNRDLEKKNITLKKENELLEKELKKIKTDTVYQEKIMREKMGVVRKNEIPVKIVPREQ